MKSLTILFMTIKGWKSELSIVDNNLMIMFHFFTITSHKETLLAIGL